MTRPRGTIRTALAASALEISNSSPLGGATWREAAVRAQVGFGAAQQTFKDMARAGELRAVGQVRVEHSCRPMTLWAPVSMLGASPGGDDLAAAMRSWAEFK